MEETKIWSVDGEGTSATQLGTTDRMETEGLLEDILTANPDMLEEGLQLVGRQTSTAGGPLDLLGVDTDGRLVVYELKRGTLNRDAVAQVIDYASALNAADTEILSLHIAGQSRNARAEPINDFEQWYNDNWPEGSLESLMPPRMVLVGLGVDVTTERMVNYMSSSGMDISVLTFHGFRDGAKTLLARTVEVERVDNAAGAPRKPRSRPNRTQFMERTQPLTSDVRDALDNAERMIRSQIRGYTTTYTYTRMNFSLDYSWRPDTFRRAVTLFIEVEEEKNALNVGFYPLAIDLASTEEFDKLKKKGFNFDKTSSTALVHIGDINYDIKFPVHSIDDWEGQVEMLTALTRRVFEAYNAAKEKALPN